MISAPPTPRPEAERMTIVERLAVLAAIDTVIEALEQGRPIGTDVLNVVLAASGEPLIQNRRTIAFCPSDSSPYRHVMAVAHLSVLAATLEDSHD